MPDTEVKYDINYDDERFAKVESDKNQALAEVGKTYDGMISESDKFYQDQINASQDWADTQTQLQQDQTDFTIEQIEQQKDQAYKDYVKEQSGSYVDWQKQSNRYGVEAERQAAVGMDGTGYSESSQVSMYNTYQNRIATARESYNKAVLNYDNAIKEARLQNNSILAEIAHNALQEQLKLSIEGFQYKNTLILDKANKKIELDNTYYNRYLDVLNQINTENALAEEVRQYNQNYDLQVKQFNEEVRQFNKQYEENVRQFNQSYNLQLKEYNESIRQFNEEIARLKKKDEREYKLQIQELELEKKQIEQEKKQWEEEMKLKKKQLEEEKRQFNAQMSAKSSSSSSGGSSGAKIEKTSSSDGDSSLVKQAIRSAFGSGSSGGTTDTPTNNMASITALGYGPISASRLAELIASGEVTRTLKNGQYYYSRKTPSSTNTSSSTNRLKNMGLSR